MRPVASFARILNFIGTFPLDITAVPLWARWGFISFLPLLISHIPPLVLLRYSLDDLLVGSILEPTLDQEVFPWSRSEKIMAL